MVQPGQGEIQRYQALLAEDPTSRAFGLLAEAYLRQGRYADTIAVCDLGLQHYPAFAGARLVLARALAARGDASRAETEFRRVLENLPDSIPAHRGLADLLRQQERAEDALVLYENVLALDPFDQEVRGLVEALRAAPVPALDAAARQAPAEIRALGESPLSAVELEPAIPTFDLTSVAAEAVSLPLTPVPAEPLPTAPVPAPPRAGPEEDIPLFDLTDLAREDEAEEAAEEAAARTILATETLADLYVQQGFPEQARVIYEELAHADPTRADLRGKLAALQPPTPREAETAEPVLEPVGIGAFGPGDDGGDLVGVLEAWLAAARSLRAERGRG